MQVDLTKLRLQQLLEVLRSNVVIFTYKKLNGEDRRAVGTLSTKVIQEFIGTHEENFNNTKDNPILISYFDLEKKEFRSFYATRLVEIESLTRVDNTTVYKKVTLLGELYAKIKYTIDQSITKSEIQADEVKDILGLLQSDY